MKKITIQCEALTAEGFAPFGDVIQSEGASHYSINGGTIERYHDLARIDVDPDGKGRPVLSIAQCKTTSQLPLRVPLMERHALGSQSFIPLNETPMVVVVGEAGDSLDPGSIRAFVTNGKQGINYHRGVWHMPLISSEPDQRFLIVDRAGPGRNCEEFPLEDYELMVTR